MNLETLNWRELRLRLGFTQSEVAHHAGLSLPMTQLIESGRSNPSLATLEKLASALKVKIAISLIPIEPDWQILRHFGLPLIDSTAPKTIKTPPLEQFFSELRSAWAWTRTAPNSREGDAVTALLWALKLHFPSVYRKIYKKTLDPLANQSRTAREIKLYRIARAKVAEIF